MSDDITETAKAAQEVAKATGKGIDALVKSGSFFAKHIDAPLEAAIGHITDRLRYSRQIRAARLFVRLQEEMRSLGLDANTNPLPLGFAVDAIEQGSLEDDDDLQDLWVRLLANAASADACAKPRRSYISILKDLTALDARCFELIYSVEYRHEQGGLILTKDFPRSVRLSIRGDETREIGEPSEEVKLSLLNLQRLGLLRLPNDMHEQPLFRHVYQTLPGSALSKALQRRQS